MNKINQLAKDLYSQYRLDTPGLEKERDVFRDLRNQTTELHKSTTYFHRGYCGQPGIDSMRETMDTLYSRLETAGFEYLKDLARENDLTKAARRVKHLETVLKSIKTSLSNVINGYWCNGQLKNIDLNQFPKVSCCESFLAMFGMQSRESLLHTQIINALEPVRQNLTKLKAE